MHKSSIVACIFIILVSSCHRENIENKICQNRSNGIKRPCTSEEILFIKDWNFIVDKINNFDINTFDKSFFSFSHGDKKLPKIILLGEVHNHIEGILENWGYIKYLAKNGPVHVLLEGLDASKFGGNDNLRKLNEIIIIVLHKRLADEKVAYHPDVWDRLAAARYNNAIDNFFSTIDHLVKIPFTKNINFSYWDDANEKDVKYVNMVRRNTSILNSITQKLRAEKNARVVVMAGFEHLPLGDYYTAYVAIPQLGLALPPHFSQFYTLAKQFRTTLKLGSENFFDERVGATQVLYEGLDALGINNIQAIPRSSLKNWKDKCRYCS